MKPKYKESKKLKKSKKLIVFDFKIFLEVYSRNKSDIISLNNSSKPTNMDAVLMLGPVKGYQNVI